MDIIRLEVFYMENTINDQDRREQSMSFITMVVLTGLIGGIFWSAIGYVGYFFNFTEIRPNVILEPWALGGWKNGWIGTVFSIFMIGIVSIVPALIYFAVLRKYKNIFVGLVYGILLFLLVYYVLNPIFPSIAPVSELKRNTIVTSVCLYILFGIFVGYSISYEEEEQQLRRKREKEVPS